jgi:dTDP-glucose 4,6-dehydratase
MPSSPPAILVTGGAGFIGSHWVRHLLEHAEDQVVHLDALTYAGNLHGWGEWLDHPRHSFFHGSINDAALVQRLLQTYRPRAVVHLAAESHVDRSIDGPGIFVETNVLGTMTLLREVESYWRGMAVDERAQFRFLHLSTDEVFGSLSAQAAAFCEQTPYAPRSPYSASKAAADHMVRAWHHTYGLPTLVAHSSNNYGPRQFPEKLIPLAIVRMLRGEPIPLYGDGAQVRDWLHVEDHCRALALILERGQPGDTYVLGTGREMTNRDLLHLLCEQMDQWHPRADGGCYADFITPVSDRPGHDRRYAIDPTFAKQHLGWQPEISLEQGLRSTVQWYLEHRDWWLRILEQGPTMTARRGVLLSPSGSP